MTKSKNTKIDWYFDKLREGGPACAEFGPLCLSVTKVDDCTGRWLFTGDLPTSPTEEPRGGIFGLAESREEGMKRATEAAIIFASRRLRAVKK